MGTATRPRDEEAERKKREREWLLLLLLLVGEVRSDLTNAVHRYQAGDWSGWEFGEYAYRVLLPAHRRAAYLGRRLAGETRGAAAGATLPPNSIDEDLGWAQAEGQRPFLREFVADLGNGEYGRGEDFRVAMVIRRAELYALRLAGTANEGWALNLATDMTVRWVDVNDEAECPDCLSLAADGPYLVKDLPTYPGRGDTQCLMNCRCQLVTEDGDYSVDLRYLFDREESRN